VTELKLQGPKLGGKKMNLSPAHTTEFWVQKDKGGKMREAGMRITRNIYRPGWMFEIQLREHRSCVSDHAFMSAFLAN